ncbi:hypothetical protein ACNKHR_00660 [Shigella flexneri]
MAPQRIMRLDEASDRGRYLMIGAAEHGFCRYGAYSGADCESDLPVNALPAVVRILAAPSTPSTLHP